MYRVVFEAGVPEAKGMRNTRACSAHLTSLADAMTREKISAEEAEESIVFKSERVRVRSETKHV